MTKDPRVPVFSQSYSDITTAEQRASFRDDGVVCLRDIVSPDAITQLRAAVDAIVADPQPRALRRAPGFAGDFVIQGGVGRFHNIVRQFAEDSGAKQAASEILESSVVTVFNEVVFVKEPGAGPTEWHNDYSYMGLAGTKICTVWIALDHVTADTGAMFFVRGSHKDRKLYRPILLGTGRERPTGESREAIPNVWSQTGTGNLVSFDLDPGDCTVHHAWTLHGAKANSSRSERRRGLAIRYVGDDVSELPSRFGVLRGDRA